jgi:hypothetical protein
MGGGGSNGKEIEAKTLSPEQQKALHDHEAK